MPVGGGGTEVRFTLQDFTVGMALGGQGKQKKGRSWWEVLVYINSRHPAIPPGVNVFFVGTLI